MEDLFFSVFPQLTFEIGDDTCESDKYYRYFAYNIRPDTQSSRPFAGMTKGEILTPFEGTRVYCLTFSLREDFERAVHAVCHKCRSTPAVPATTGAMTVFGVRNAEETEKALEKLAKNGTPEDRFAGLKLLRENGEYKRKCTDALFFISSGPYSDIPYTETPYGEEEWNRVSAKIRLYHELTHVFSRRFFPEHQDAVRDEMLADAIGLLCATGKYDPVFGKRLIGIGANGYMPGGRLENYIEKEDVFRESRRAALIAGQAGAFIASRGGEEPFELLREMEEQKIGTE